MNALNMFLCGGVKSFTKTMWLFNFLCIFVSACGISAEILSFHKCCPRNSNLLQVSVEFNTTTETYYECLNDTIKNLYNITNNVSPLIMPDSIKVQYGIPPGCHLELLPIVKSEVRLTVDSDLCYDRLFLEVANGTLKYIIPKTVALKCTQNSKNIINETKVTVTQIRKCCRNGQGYDTEYHVCRNNTEINDEEWLVNKLRKDNLSMYEVDVGLNCKSREYAVELSEGKYIFDVEGSVLKITSRNGLLESFSKNGEWCMDRGYSDGLVARVCTDDCAKFGAYCLRKCCPIGQHFQPMRCGSLKSKCVPSSDETVLFNISAYLDPLRNDYDDFEDVLGIRTILTCPRGRVALNRSAAQDYHTLTRAGYIDSPISISNDYCVEIFDTRDCTGDFTLSAVTCYVKPLLIIKDFRTSFVLISISSVCLALTLVVYLALPELRNHHGRTLICHLCTMLLAYSCLARVQYALVEDRFICTLLGYGIYFGFVAAFAWLNVMCFDMWWTFGTLQKPMHNSNKITRRFLWYSVYAWSISILLTLTTFLLDKYPVSPILQARIGQDMCWFGSLQNDKTDWPHYILFVIPMGIVTCINFILWVLTARHCASVKSRLHRMQAGSATDRDKRRFRIDRAKYLLTGKLWAVMGAGWVSELLSTLAHEPQWLWFIIDLLNELQGVFIFIILIFKPKLYYLIRKRLGLEKPNMQKNGTSSSGRTSSTFLSRTISSDERTTLRTSLPNNVKQH